MQKLSLAFRMTPSGLNVITAWLRLIASIWPLESTALFFASVITVANFTIRTRRPALSAIEL